VLHVDPVVSVCIVSKHQRVILVHGFLPTLANPDIVEHYFENVADALTRKIASFSVKINISLFS